MTVVSGKLLLLVLFFRAHKHKYAGWRY